MTGTEPTPWATGLLVAAFAAAVVLAGIIGFGTALAAIHPLLAVGFNVVVVGGAAPTVWRWRHAPVWRWTVYGAGAGVVFGWTALILGSIQ